MKLPDERVDRLVNRVVSKMPSEALDIPSLSSLRLLATSLDGKLAALTRVTIYESTMRDESGREWIEENMGQEITLYRDLINALSDGAAMAVIAHEVAHAWLNHHVRPEDSKEREMESDELARKWGFTEEMASLDDETLEAA